MQNIARLVEEHDSLDKMAQCLSILVSSPFGEAHVAFDALRSFATQIDMHRVSATELINNGETVCPEFSAFARVHEASFHELTSEWQTYLTEWTEENIGEDWQAFAAATRWMMREVRAQIEAENNLLYPLAHKHGLIQLRPVH
jgi:hypothetical protein